MTCEDGCQYVVRNTPRDGDSIVCRICHAHLSLPAVLQEYHTSKTAQLLADKSLQRLAHAQRIFGSVRRYTSKRTEAAFSELRDAMMFYDEKYSND